MTKGLGTIQKEIMEHLEDSGAIDTDWFTIWSIFAPLRAKSHVEIERVDISFCCLMIGRGR